MASKQPRKPTFRVLAEFTDQAIYDKRVLAKLARQIKASGKTSAAGETPSGKKRKS